MGNRRRWLGFVVFGIGVIAIIGAFRGGRDRWEGVHLSGERDRGVAVPQAPAGNADYLRGYADGLEAAQQPVPHIGPQGFRHEFRGHDDHGGPFWPAFIALPLLLIGGGLLLRNRRRRWGRGRRYYHYDESDDDDDDYDQRPPSEPKRRHRPYTSDTVRL